MARPSYWPPIKPYPRISKEHRRRVSTQKYSSDRSWWMTHLGTFKQLLFQSDFRPTPTTPVTDDGARLRTPESGQVRLIDQAEHRCNYEIWAELIEFRCRNDGQAALISVLDAMQHRDVPLPDPNDKRHMRFWNLVMETFIHDEAIASDVWRHLGRITPSNVEIWRALYVLVMLRVLESSETQSLSQWHEKFVLNGVADAQAYQDLVRAIVKELPQEEYMRAFLDFHRPDEPRKCVTHDLLMSMKSRDPALATMQAKLVALGDLSTYLDDLPSHLQGSARLAGRFKIDDLPRPEGAHREAATSTSMTRGELVETIDRIRGTKPQGLSDDTAARAFATTAFSVDAIISGLTSFGLQVLGPRALRELATRCAGPEEISSKIEKLRAKRVQLRDCAYNRLIQTLAMARRRNVLDSLLQCDLHPDAFEERNTQQELLQHYVLQGDVVQAHRTLFVLAREHGDRPSQSWNYIFQAFLKKGDVEQIMMTLDDMTSRQITVSASSLRTGFSALVKPRVHGPSSEHWTSVTRHAAPPALSSFDDLGFMTQMLKAVANTGAHIPHYLWKRLLQYYGMDGRLMEMEKLTMWLLARYPLLPPSPKTEHPLRSLGGKSRPSVPRALPICDSHFHRAIIEWGFKTIGHWIPWGNLTLGFKTSRPARHMRTIWERDNFPYFAWWDRGIMLSFELARRGVSVDLNLVRGVLRRRFLTLFGLARISDRKENRRSHRANIPTLREMVNRVNYIWDNQIYGDVELLNDQQLVQRIFPDNARFAEQLLHGMQHQQEVRDDRQLRHDRNVLRRQKARDKKTAARIREGKSMKLWSSRRRHRSKHLRIEERRVAARGRRLDWRSAGGNSGRPFSDRVQTSSRFSKSQRTPSSHFKRDQVTDARRDYDCGLRPFSEVEKNTVENKQGGMRPHEDSIWS